MKDLAVIIVNYNVRHFLEQCLLSVRNAMEGLDAEVWVVDNTSVDGSVEMVKEKFPWVNLIENRENVGFSAANNQAIRVCDSRYVLLLNPDTVVEESTFRRCVKFMDEHADAGALGVKMIDGDGNFLPESKRGLPTPWVAFYKIFGLQRIFPRSRKFGRYHLGYLDPEQTHAVDVLSGAFMLMRKEVLDKIGLLDESFFMYGEDIDLSWRVVQAGWKNYYYPGTRIIHYKGESTKKGSLNYVRVFYNAMIIFARKHFSKGSQRMYIFLIQLAIWFRAGLAVMSRVSRAIAFPGIEFLLIFAGVIAMKEYWEYAHKLLKDNIPYPPEFDYYAAPLYALVFVCMLGVTGAYRRPFRFRSVLVAAFAGFIAIATITYVIKDINYSRVIVGLSSLVTAFIGIATRSIVNLVKDGTLFFAEESKKRAVIVGDEAEAEKIGRMIRNELDYPVEIEGAISPGAERMTGNPFYIGTLTQLPEIISWYKIEEVIFSNKSLSTRTILDIMSSLGNPNVHFKIVPPDADYLVGPQVIHSAGYQAFNLGSKEQLSKKRTFDILSSLTMVLTFPLLFWLYKNPAFAFRNLLHVLRGDYHLVGYIRTEPEGLPRIKQGLLNMMHRVRRRDASTSDHSAGLDRHYARSWSLALDMEILLKGFRRIGEDRKGVAG